MKKSTSFPCIILPTINIKGDWHSRSQAVSPKPANDVSSGQHIVLLAQRLIPLWTSKYAIVADQFIASCNVPQGLASLRQQRCKFLSGGCSNLAGVEKKLREQDLARHLLHT